MLFVSVLVAIAILSFLPSGQRLIEKVTFGWVKAGIIPWIGIGAIFLWSYRVVPTPTLRGIIFGLLILSIAFVLSWWAPRNQNVKSLVKNMFFGGRDIWSLRDYKMYVGAIWGAGIVLALPLRGVDAILNAGALVAAIAYFGWQAYKGHTRNNLVKHEEGGSVPENA